jgi:hypothetical protein
LQVEIVARWLLVINAMIDGPEATTTESSDPLTWAEICQRYPDQWVALVEMEWVDADEEESAPHV